MLHCAIRRLRTGRAPSPSAVISPGPRRGQLREASSGLGEVRYRGREVPCNSSVSSGEPGVTVRWRPSADRAVMAAAALGLILFAVFQATTSMDVISLLSLAPLIVATVADERRTAVF